MRSWRWSFRTRRANHPAESPREHHEPLGIPVAMPWPTDDRLRAPRMRTNNGRRNRVPATPLCHFVSAYAGRAEPGLEQHDAGRQHHGNSAPAINAGCCAPSRAMTAITTRLTKDVGNASTATLGRRCCNRRLTHPEPGRFWSSGDAHVPPASGRCMYRTTRAAHVACRPGETALQRA